MKNSFPILWGGKEENEYPRTPLGFRGSMTLTLKRAWSKNEASQPQGWSLIPQGDGPGLLWQWEGKGMGCRGVGTGALSHTGYDSILPKSPTGTVSPWFQWGTKQNVLPGELWSSCSVPSENKVQGWLLQRRPRGRRVWKEGLAEAERLRGSWASFAHRTGDCVQENNELKLGFVWGKPTADPI